MVLRQEFLQTTFFGVVFFFPVMFAFGQKNDTIKTDVLPSVEILATPISPFSINPTQTGTRVKEEEIHTMNAVNVADITKQFSGVTVKDYGGVGGLKTVSVRGLGSQHNVVTYDGVMMSDAQTGQTDLGKISSDHLTEVGLSVGGNENIFQSARNFSSASVLNIETAAPVYDSLKKHSLLLQTIGGSFGLWGYGGNISHTFNKRWSFSLRGSHTSSQGNYPFTLKYGWNLSDSVSREHRSNSDVHISNAEWNLFGNFQHTTLHLKTYAYFSERGLPGSTILYYQNSRQRLKDATCFLQSRITHEINEHWKYKNYNKLHYGNIHYQNPDILNSDGMQEDDYIQREYYTSHSILYTPRSSLEFSLNTDGVLQNMDAQVGAKFPRPIRHSWLTVFAAHWNHKGFDMQADVLQTYISDRRSDGNGAGKTYRLSPHITAGFHYNNKIFVSVFYKDIFRMPTFNDLYYNKVGNVNLKPEKAKQYNFHCVWRPSFFEKHLQHSLSIDAFAAFIEDKIVAIPTKNLFVWSMVNLGKVETKGISVAMESFVFLSAKDKIQLRLHYDFQHSIDKTDPESSTYEHQIPYIPLHSGSASLSYHNPHWRAGYNLLVSGERYALRENIQPNRLKPYADHNISMEYIHPWKIMPHCLITISIKAEILNLLSASYEVIKYFPMPERSFRLTLKITY